jgi:oxygen-independent coproporphyrinogen III oxidase
MNAPGLYIHIPFCLKKCDYCDFYSVTTVARIPDYIGALSKEMEMVQGQWGAFDTLYLGGGTPSVLAISQVREVLTRIQENFALLPEAEISVEANPGDLDLMYAEGLCEAGVNRLTIGVQSFDQRVLDFLGRRHTVQHAEMAIEASRKAGLDNIGLDLIYGVPGQSLESWLSTLEQALRFEPEHLSCYQLTVEDRTPLGIKVQRGEIAAPGENLQHTFFMKTSEFLEHAGYIHYEVSNFAKDMTWASRHNQKYWDHTPYLGLGPAAHSFQTNRRWWNYRSLDQYVSDLKSGYRPVEEMETLTMEQLGLEALYLGLRTRKGIRLQDFSDRYHMDLWADKPILARLQEEELVSIRDGYLSPTRAGLAMADSLALI